MIAWDSFFTYILKPTINLKIIVGLILICAFFIRRSDILERAYRALRKVPLRPAIFTAIALAFLMRLSWVLWSPHIPPASISEDAQIWRHALDLSQGLGFKTVLGEYTAWRPIGYPFFLSLLIRLFGPELYVAELFQVFFSTATVYCVYLIGKKLESERFGLIAALVFAFYPVSVMGAKIILDEHIFILLWLVGLLFLISDYQKPSIKKLLVGSLAVGVSALFRTYSVMTAPVLVVAWLLGKKDVRGAFFRGIVLLTLVYVCAIPWAVRNHYRLGAPVFHTALLGVQLYYANNATSDVRYPVNPAPEEGGDLAFLNAKNDVERDLAGRRAAIEWIRSNPSLFLQKAFGRVCYMLGLNREGWVVEDNFATIRSGVDPPSPQLRKGLEKLEQYYYVIIFWFGVFGCIAMIATCMQKGDQSGWLIVLGTVFFYLLVTAIALNHRKYKVPLEPFFCLLASYGFLKAFFGYASEKMRLNSDE